MRVEGQSVQAQFVYSCIYDSWVCEHYFPTLLQHCLKWNSEAVICRYVRRLENLHKIARNVCRACTNCTPEKSQFNRRFIMFNNANSDENVTANPKDGHDDSLGSYTSFEGWNVL